MYACMYVHMHVCMYACMHVCMYVWTYACMHACMYVYICIFEVVESSAHIVHPCYSSPPCVSILGHSSGHVRGLCAYASTCTTNMYVHIHIGVYAERKSCDHAWQNAWQQNTSRASRCCTCVLHMRSLSAPVAQINQMQSRQKFTPRDAATFIAIKRNKHAVYALSSQHQLAF